MKFGNSLARVISWEDTRIVVKAPTDYGTGIDDMKFLLKIIGYATGGAWGTVFDIVTGLLVPDVAVAPTGGLTEKVQVRTPDGMSNKIDFTWTAPDTADTSVGSNVPVTPPGAILMFNNVTGEGTTTATTSQYNPSGSIPSGYRVISPFVDISTTATYAGLVTVGVSYDPSGVINPQNLRLFHWEGSNWVDCTWAENPVDTVNHLVYGQVTSLSPFFAGDPLGAGAAGVPVFPNIYIGIAAVLGAGVLAYFVRRRLVQQG